MSSLESVTVRYENKDIKIENVPIDLTIAELKERISNSLNSPVPVDCIRLILMGRVLTNHQTLKELKITSERIIHMAVRSELTPKNEVYQATNRGISRINDNVGTRNTSAQSSGEKVSIFNNRFFAVRPNNMTSQVVSNSSNSTSCNNNDNSTNNENQTFRESNETAFNVPHFSPYPFIGTDSAFGFPADYYHQSYCPQSYPPPIFDSRLNFPVEPSFLNGFYSHHPHSFCQNNPIFIPQLNQDAMRYHYHLPIEYTSQAQLYNAFLRNSISDNTKVDIHLHVSLNELESVPSALERFHENMLRINPYHIKPNIAVPCNNSSTLVNPPNDNVSVDPSRIESLDSNIYTFPNFNNTNFLNNSNRSASSNIPLTNTKNIQASSNSIKHRDSKVVNLTDSALNVTTNNVKDHTSEKSINIKSEQIKSSEFETSKCVEKFVSEIINLIIKNNIPMALITGNWISLSAIKTHVNELLKPILSEYSNIIKTNNKKEGIICSANITCQQEQLSQFALRAFCYDMAQQVTYRIRSMNNVLSVLMSEVRPSASIHILSLIQRGSFNLFYDILQHFNCPVDNNDGRLFAWGQKIRLILLQYFGSCIIFAEKEIFNEGRNTTSRVLPNVSLHLLRYLVQQYIPSLSAMVMMMESQVPMLIRSWIEEYEARRAPKAIEADLEVFKVEVSQYNVSNIFIQSKDAIIDIKNNFNEIKGTNNLSKILQKKEPLTSQATKVVNSYTDTENKVSPINIDADEFIDQALDSFIKENDNRKNENESVDNSDSLSCKKNSKDGENLEKLLIEEGIDENLAKAARMDIDSLE